MHDIRIIFCYRHYHVSRRLKSTLHVPKVSFSFLVAVNELSATKLFVTFSVRDVTSFGVASSLTNYTRLGQKKRFQYGKNIVKSSVTVALNLRSSDKTPGHFDHLQLSVASYSKSLKPISNCFVLLSYRRGQSWTCKDLFIFSSPNMN